MSPLNTLTLVLVVCATVLHTEAFTAPSTARPSCALHAGRRDFLDAAMSTTAGLVMASIPLVAGAEEEAAAPAAISDDLAMPSAEEQKKIDDDAAAAMAERLAKKAALQKEKARPATFQDSLAKELEKKKGLQMSKEERRNALCEELGRGC